MSDKKIRTKKNTIKKLYNTRTRKYNMIGGVKNIDTNLVEFKIQLKLILHFYLFLHYKINSKFNDTDIIKNSEEILLLKSRLQNMNKYAFEPYTMRILIDINKKKGPIKNLLELLTEPKDIDDTPSDQDSHARSGDVRMSNGHDTKSDGAGNINIRDISEEEILKAIQNIENYIKTEYVNVLLIYTIFNNSSLTEENLKATEENLKAIKENLKAICDNPPGSIKEQLTKLQSLVEEIYKIYKKIDPESSGFDEDKFKSVIYDEIIIKLNDLYESDNSNS